MAAVILDFAPETGRLRLDLEAFDALVAHPAEGSDAAGALAVAGVLGDDGAVVAALRPAVDAARAPICLMDVSVAGENTVTTHRMWVGAAGAACLLHVTDGIYQVFVVTPAAVPALVAKGVGLGPRPRVAGPAVRCPAAAVAGLTAPDRAHVAWGVAQLADGCPPEWADVAEKLREGRWRLWSAQTTWPGPGLAPGGRSITALDTPAGMVTVADPGGDTAENTPDAVPGVGGPDASRAAELTPTTPSAVWLALAGLLPVDAELPRG